MADLLLFKMFAHSLFLCCDVRWCEAYGGVYADIDVEATKCFDPLLRAAHNAGMAVLLGEVRNGHGRVKSGVCRSVLQRQQIRLIRLSKLVRVRSWYEDCLVNHLIVAQCLQMQLSVFLATSLPGQENIVHTVLLEKRRGMLQTCKQCAVT